VCIVLLTLSATSRRAPFGFFSALVGVGIGSQSARTALPLLLGLTYIVIWIGSSLVVAGKLTVPYGAALAAAFMAAVLHILIVWLARTGNDLERQLRDLSMSDELTGLHNRRSFYLLGEQARRNARRERRPLSIVFFDADGLKRVNDTLGHDVGSELLATIARLLRGAFRSTDVVARLGGDEFAVAAYGSPADLETVMKRLDDAISATNAVKGVLYQVSLSRGIASTEPQSNEPFAELVDRADAAMYQDKQRRRAPATPPTPPVMSLAGSGSPGHRLGPVRLEAGSRT
jgi:diguanylate cyclase (GGDEF)-like protein